MKVIFNLGGNLPTIRMDIMVSVSWLSASPSMGTVSLDTIWNKRENITNQSRIFKLDVFESEF